jgi:hypothetical protein
LGFVLWWVSLLNFYQAQFFFFITKNLVITYKLNTIKGFYYKVNDFSTVLVFLGFCHNPKKIAKEKEEKEIKKCVVGVNM